MRFREVLRAEFERRRAINRRYSLRSFARALRVHHTTLSRLFRSNTAVSARVVRRLALRLAISTNDVALLCTAETEAAVIALTRRAQFRPSSRWIASAIGLPIDDVNVALQNLLRTRALQMVSREEWRAVE